MLLIPGIFACLLFMRGISLITLEASNFIKQHSESVKLMWFEIGKMLIKKINYSFFILALWQSCVLYNQILELEQLHYTTLTCKIS